MACLPLLLTKLLQDPLTVINGNDNDDDVFDDDDDDDDGDYDVMIDVLQSTRSTLQPSLSL